MCKENKKNDVDDRVKSSSFYSFTYFLLVVYAENVPVWTLEDRIPKSVDTRYAYPDTCIRETAENFGIVERDFGSQEATK